MTSNEKRDLLVMKFLHYFITKQNYNPVVVHGVQNEIWLENMDSEFRIVRIVTGYIHNKEQLDFDLYKVKRLVSQIKRKTFTFNMKVLTLYLDLNEDIKLIDEKNNLLINVKNEKVLKKNETINNYFPDMPENLKFTEEGAMLYQKINNDILKKNMDQSEKINELFMPKKPYITYLLIGIMCVLFILMYFLGKGSTNIPTLYKFGGLIKNGSPIRLFTSMFLHIGVLHILMNAWALRILGTQTEKFYGHIKMFIIFIYSGLIGNLLSVLLMSENTISAGASGAIFGLMGAILYFALNQRTYIGETLKKEILPVILINVLIGFMLPSINMYAHIGGLIGGMLISCAVGIKYKTSKIEKTNGIICSVILVAALIFLCYFM